ncbi:hypothetical protein [Natrarchaeobaculum aegyptiacum]|uniref:Uncharacterized protein n=1 Tax=Natrarchaeobaculum aegyptiacum TaxID=745377 RepID=A0A2Z2I0Y8_9EURY|nr:hypothetical protein [Natrarchaeobaculum aegyptiacum]ARS89958.1 hypothetical protein B1756_09605 [Natrarchaeobaculum aegyptiacum]
MTTHEPFGQIGRVLIAIALVGCLVGLIVGYGEVGNEPLGDRLPTEDEFAPEPDAYVGERVVVVGTIVETDPVVMEVTYGDDRTTEFVLEGYVAEPSMDSRELVTGDLVDESTIVVVGSETREPWESYYMYGVSAVAVLWVVVRFVRGWRFDRAQLAFVPRATPAVQARPEACVQGHHQRQPQRTIHRERVHETATDDPPTVTTAERNATTTTPGNDDA